MALTNKGLREILSKAGVDTEHMDGAVTAIMAGHNTALDALKEREESAVKERDAAVKERDSYKADAEKLAEVQKELETVKGGDWENKYKQLQADISARESRAEKEKAVRDYFSGKGISGKEQEIAMLSSGTVIDALELKKDGSIKDAAALDALVAGPLAPLVSYTETVPAHNPPESGDNAVRGGKTAKDILAIKDDAELVRAIEANPGAFGLT